MQAPSGCSVKRELETESSAVGVGAVAENPVKGGVPGLGSGSQGPRVCGSKVAGKTGNYIGSAE